MDIEKKNLIRKIIGALVNAFFLPGLGQIIVGRVKKGLEIIGILIACTFGGFFLISSVAMLGGAGFVFFMALFLMLALVVVWVYALVDVIIWEVEPLRGEKKEDIPARKIVGILINLFFPGLGQVIVGRMKRGIVIFSISIIVVFWYFFQTPGFTMLVHEPYFAISYAISAGPPSLLWTLIAVIVWLYALIDVIMGEVKPLRDEKKEE